MLSLALWLVIAGPPGLPPLPGQPPPSPPTAPTLPPASGSGSEPQTSVPDSAVVAPSPVAPSNFPRTQIPPPRKETSGTDLRHSAPATRGSIPLAPPVQRPDGLGDPGGERRPTPTLAPTRAATGGALPWASDDLPPLTFEEDPSPGADVSEESRLPGDGTRGADGSPEVVVRTASPRIPEPELTYRGRPRKPEKSAAFVLAYRQFSIVDRLDRRQMWHVASVEVTPLRRFFRLNLITEVGFEGGEAARDGDRADFLLVEKLGLGAQYPHWVTPFAEFQAGLGLARVELFERNDLVMLYTLGVDVGAQWAATRWLFLHAALGWVRPHLRWSEQTLRYDSFTFKLGVGF